MYPASIDFAVPSFVPPGLVLIGPPGVGKTAVGRVLALNLCCQFIDTDVLIEQGVGKQISQIFDEYGEPVFRRMESEVLRKLSTSSLSSTDSSSGEPKSAHRQSVGTVIATGAGLPMTNANFDTLNSLGYLVYLSAPIEVLSMRLSDSTDRPLLNAPGPKDTGSLTPLQAKLSTILEKRKAVYEMAQFAVDTNGRSISQVAERIIDLLALTAQPQS